MEQLEIHRADPGDADQLAAVYRSAYQENRAAGFPVKAESATAATIREWMTDHRVYAARTESRIVGGVRLTKTDSERIKLSRLGVHENWKGNGIGSKLLEYAESVGRQEDYNAIWLTTPGKHPYLPAFYRSHGYKKSGEYPLDDYDYDEIRMKKQL